MNSKELPKRHIFRIKPEGKSLLQNADQNHQRYWKFNLRFILILLSIWFLVAFILSIVAVDLLNEISIAGFPLGFWFAQQGSILVFIFLILIYALVMDREDRQYHVDEPANTVNDASGMES